MSRRNITGPPATTFFIGEITYFVIFGEIDHKMNMKHTKMNI